MVNWFLVRSALYAPVWSAIERAGPDLTAAHQGQRSDSGRSSVHGLAGNCSLVKTAKVKVVAAYYDLGAAR
jgi:hypothetical protein